MLDNNKLQSLLKLDIDNIEDIDKLKNIINNFIDILSNQSGLVYSVDNNIKPYIMKHCTEMSLESGNNLMHELYEGDNLYSLCELNKNYNKKIDIIYIDPPYNTKSKALGYKDSFEHNEWLRMMYSRLILTKNLLSDSGIVFISIDNKELADLKLLCDSIYGEDNFINILVWKKGGGKSDSRYLSTKKEYCLIYKSKNDVVFNKKKSPENNYKLVDEDGRHYQLRGFDMQGLVYSKSLDYPIEAPDGSYIYPGKSYDKYLERKSGKVNKRDWCWTLSELEFNRRLKDGLIVFKKSKDGWRVYYKSYHEDKYMPYEDTYDECGTGNGTLELKNIFGDKTVLQYPKPINYIKFLINLVNKKDALVLDFFAGSGTTGHAVIELNKEDGGNRKFILCTSNENNICKEVTYQRLKTVITGVRSDGSKYCESVKDGLLYYQLESCE